MAPGVMEGLAIFCVSSPQLSYSKGDTVAGTAGFFLNLGALFLRAERSGMKQLEVLGLEPAPSQDPFQHLCLTEY